MGGESSYRRNDDRRGFTFVEKIELLFKEGRDGIRKRKSGENRPVPAMLDEIQQRQKRFADLPWAAQSEVDENRLVPVVELAEMLEFYMENGRCRDESNWKSNPKVTRRNHGIK